jgi:hypothetical protein
MWGSQPPGSRWCRFLQPFRRLMNLMGRFDWVR